MRGGGDLVSSDNNSIYIADPCGPRRLSVPAYYIITISVM